MWNSKAKDAQTDKSETGRERERERGTHRPQTDKHTHTYTNTHIHTYKHTHTHTHMCSTICENFVETLGAEVDLKVGKLCKVSFTLFFVQDFCQRLLWFGWHCLLLRVLLQLVLLLLLLVLFLLLLGLLLLLLLPIRVLLFPDQRLLAFFLVLLARVVLVLGCALFQLVLVPESHGLLLCFQLAALTITLRVRVEIDLQQRSGRAARSIQRHGLAEKHDVAIEVVPLASENALAVALQGGRVDLIVSDWLWAARQRADELLVLPGPAVGLAAELAEKSKRAPPVTELSDEMKALRQALRKRKIPGLSAKIGACLQNRSLSYRIGACLTGREPVCQIEA